MASKPPWGQIYLYYFWILARGGDGGREKAKPEKQARKKKKKEKRNKRRLELLRQLRRLGGRAGLDQGHEQMRKHRP